MKLTTVAKGVYQSGSRFYVRPTVGGKRTTRVLNSRTLTEAIKEHARGERGFRRVPFKDLAEQWLALGCPGKDKHKRSDEFCSKAKTILAYPVSYFGPKDICSVRPSEIADYGAWRSAQVKRPGFRGHRAADIELATCASMCWWAYFSDIIPSNPFAVKFRFHKTSAVKHSPARAPRDADQAHAIGAAMLNSRKTASVGFLWLFLCMTGCRTKELRLLRTDAKPQGQYLPPGWCSDSEIVVMRGKKRDGGVDVLRLNEPAKDLLKAWKNWHASTCPDSPWWFPGRDPSAPLDAGTVCRAVKRTATRLGFDSNISPHGARSFYCSVLRTLESDDRKVADALGHTNVNMVQTIYGRRTNETNGLSWMPSTGTPGWARWSTPPDAAPMAPIKV